MTTVTRQQSEAIDECAEWAARAHPLPFPRISREPIPTRPFAPGVIERYERRKSARLLLLIVAASACLVIGVAVGVLR